MADKRKTGPRRAPLAEAHHLHCAWHHLHSLFNPHPFEWVTAANLRLGLRTDIFGYRSYLIFRDEAGKVCQQPDKTFPLQLNKQHSSMSTIATRCREQPFENPNSSTLKFYYIQDESKVNNFLIFMHFVNFFVVKKINNPNTSSHLSSLVGLSVPTSLRRNHMLS